METVRYDHTFQYSYDQSGKACPVLQITVTLPPKNSLGAQIEGVGIDAWLDTGAERSLFDGKLIAAALNINPLDGPIIPYQSVTGGVLEGRAWTVRIYNPQLGYFDLEIGVSTASIKRNILGRDFLDKVQFGLREHHQTFYLTAAA